ncbi:protein-disulfide reductase DsbD family protein [Rhodopila sp.]|uniref:protein-disulfide reductase DsbD family protein n=1 Tax=Rhodopila sp. TaxID=2480087 RepID=UPI002C369124|nr:protein-disulfide reductase DsbD domain-containing protein [Rhodopila sp.]HVZ07105.1 protein-disulfide reductase DsbD domain-containing protein [Rhodopila sp.]
MTRWLLLIAWLMTAAPWLAQPAVALESAAVRSPRAVATLVTDTDAIQPDVPFRAALRLRLADGWHTYWQNPGDAGVAPDLTVAPPATASAIDWPTPHRVQEGPLMTYAYTGEVLLPVTVRMQPGDLRAHAEWLVCKDICVPESGDFTLTLAKGAPAPSAQAPLFAAHDRAVPRPSPWKASIAPDGTLFVQGPELTARTVTDAWFVPDQPGRIQDDAAQPLSVRDGGFTLALKLAPKAPVDAPLAGVLSVRDRSGQQADVTITAQPGAAPTPAMPRLPRVLAFAFLGGLILNLMPCVFPILAMKAVSLSRGASHAAAHRRHMHALAYAGGVLAMFVGLALVLLAARSAGSAAGWGFQFASPVFVAVMAWLLLAVGLNLSGVFQVGAGLAGTGQSLTHRHDLLGSFFTGLLAVLVATPCTAPFMGVAVAAGLAAPALVTVLVFAVMGAGLAAPYVLLATLPAAARLIPRPGRWMDTLKQVLAFPMYGAAAWLLWVVSQEAGSAGVLVTAAGAVLIGFAAWAFGLAQEASFHAGRAWTRRIGRGVAVIALLAAALSLPAIGTGVAEPSSVTGVKTAEAFSADRLAALRTEGRPVFVDVTAAWCVTCLVNERVAIDTTAVRQAFTEAGVVLMRGDWTRQDPAITAYLRQNGRDGVPLYVFYPAGGGQPILLPQILTENEVLRVLRTS